ncbi:phosphoglycolate phosphatase [Vibrio sp. S4M6]|uniref:phosphoglycolate phosphatase n=1 Tax=Vibrio sinus TaxID=2946865 RepID=UPI00202A73B2|nr:phosphoglycolate phosphatase [Vibrio sinus]MCL9780440.1 phosphoglycolate phosphatase [Vibrio sinus]
MSLNTIKLIAFDLDGTLLDSVPDLAEAADKTVRALGYPSVSLEQVKSYVGNGADLLIGRALSQNIHVSSDLDSATLAKARQLFDDFYQQGEHQLSHLYPHVKSVLEQLHQAGFTLALVTNKPAKFVPEILEKHGLSGYFTDVIGGDTFINKKPDPEALHWLLAKHGLSAGEMLMIGDSKNDILAAQNAGCHSFALTYGYNHGEPIANSNPDYVADSLLELLDIVLVAA